MVEQHKRTSGKSVKRISYGRRAAIWIAVLLVVLTAIAGVITTRNGNTALAAVTTVAITKSGGWLETAYVEWAPVSDATGYNVYYKPAGAIDSQYTKIDSALIRRYSSRYRADVLGLATGNYVIKVVPTDSGGEVVTAAAVTEALIVKPHAREGFAFSPASPMGTASGGYNDDGTVPTNAQIVYITADTVNTVTLTVITNNKGATTACTGLVNILAARQKGYDKTPLIFRLIGKIRGADITGLNSSGYIQVKGCYNVTLEGVGEDATVYEWGILVRAARNVEIRNLGLMLFPDDGISLDTDNQNIWVHNNDIFYGKVGGDSDQAKGDGSCDVKGFSDYITVSYNHFWDSGKSSLCGMGDSDEFHVTYSHNWFDHSDSRHPRIRVGTVHVYNNYFDGISKYGVGNTTGGSAFVEANYFRHCKYPMLISKQGTDIYYDSTGTFSGEPGGMIKAYNNKIEDATRLVYAQENATQFDAYLATTRAEQVPSAYQTVNGGNTYNNFDTASTMYAYTPDAPEDVRTIVTTYAGRVNGGDFKWTFTDADDTSYDVNDALKQKILSYQPDQSTVPVPAAPTNPAATADNGQVSLSWTASANAVCYNVKRATAAGGPYTTVKAGLVATSYTDTGLTNGTKYYYVISAMNEAAGESANSTEVSATPALSIPTAPTNLVATAGNQQITLSWTASTSAISYNVKRATAAGGSYTTVKTGLAATSYTDAGLTNGIKYYYVVSAVNAVGESVNSTEINVTPEYSLISNLVVNDTGNMANWSVQSNVQVGSLTYGDRDYVIATMPSFYAGSQYIRSANNSKSYVGIPLVSFTVNASVTVYVAFDDRVSPKPDWLSSWTDMGDNIVDNEKPAVTYSLYGKNFASGDTVALGPNQQSSGVCGYFVIVKTNALPAIGINNVSVTEGNSGTTNAVFTVSLSKASEETVTVNYATADGTATTADSDYVAAAGTITFNSGETAKEITVIVNGDTLNEEDEVFYVDLSEASANATIATSRGTGTIRDDDRQPAATPVFSIAGGNYNTPQAVTISCDTAGAEIRYTSDGGEPTANSTAYLGETIMVNSSVTLKAKAYLTGWLPSAEASAAYAILSTSVTNQPGNSEATNSPAVLKTAQGYRSNQAVTYNSATLLVGKGTSGRNSDLWLDYPNISGAGSGQIPSNAQIVQAKLVLTVINITGNPYRSRGLKIFTVTDPDAYGAPYFGVDGIRNGLDFYYRDHRPGKNLPWKNNAADITALFNETAAVDSFGFVPTLFQAAGESQIQLDVTASVQAWVDGQPNQGCFLTIDTSEGWQNGDGIEFYGVTASDTTKRPALEITYLTQGVAVAPDPITELAANSGATQVTLTWTTPTAASGVRVVRKAGAVPFGPLDGTLVYDGPAGNVTDHGLTNGTTYYYSVFAYDSLRNYSGKVWISAVPTVGGGLPATPGNLGVAITGQNMQFNWNQNGTAVNWLVLEQQEAEGDWVVIANPEGGATSYAIALDNPILELKPNALYQYRIKAVNAYGVSAYSNSASVTIPDIPTTPSDLAWKIISAGRISLSWTDRATNETGYRIDIINAVNNSVLWTVNLAANSNEASLTGFVSGNAYIIKVIAINGTGTAAAQTEVITTTADPKTGL